MSSVPPFEVRAIEGLFSLQLHLLRSQYSSCVSKVDKLLAAIGLHSLLPARLQESIFNTKDELSDILERTTGCVKILEATLDNEENLAFMNLKMLRTNPSIYL
jgi:hypothetical protein